MDKDVEAKLEEATWFLKELNSLRDSPKYSGQGGIGHLDKQDQLALQSCVEAFLFVLVSAKDMFLQEINRSLVRPLPLGHVTENSLTEAFVRECCRSPGSTCPSKTLCTLEQIAHPDGDGWLARLKMYRNAADHRCVLPLTTDWDTKSSGGLGPTVTWSTIKLVKDPDEQGNSENVKNVQDGPELFAFLNGVMKEMRRALARWEADLGLAASPAP